MTVAAFNKLASDLTPKILAAFDGFTGKNKDATLTSKEISEKAIEAAGLGGKLTDGEKVNLANLYSKRVASLARPGVDKLFRNPDRDGRQFSYRLFRDGDVNTSEGKKAEGAAKPSAANGNTKGKPSAANAVAAQAAATSKNKRVISAINDLDSGVVTKIAAMGLDELQAVVQVSMTRMSELVTATASELDDTRSKLERITSAVAA